MSSSLNEEVHYSLPLFNNLDPNHLIELNQSKLAQIQLKKRMVRVQGAPLHIYGESNATS